MGENVARELGVSHRQLVSTQLKSIGQITNLKEQLQHVILTENELSDVNNNIKSYGDFVPELVGCEVSPRAIIIGDCKFEDCVFMGGAVARGDDTPNSRIEAVRTKFGPSSVVHNKNFFDEGCYIDGLAHGGNFGKNVQLYGTVFGSKEIGSGAIIYGTVVGESVDENRVVLPWKVISTPEEAVNLPTIEQVSNVNELLKIIREDGLKYPNHEVIGKFYNEILKKYESGIEFSPIEELTRLMQEKKQKFRSKFMPNGLLVDVAKRKTGTYFNITAEYSELIKGLGFDFRAGKMNYFGPYFYTTANFAKFGAKCNGQDKAYLQAPSIVVGDENAFAHLAALVAQVMIKTGKGVFVAPNAKLIGRNISLGEGCWIGLDVRLDFGDKDIIIPPYTYIPHGFRANSPEELYRMIAERGGSNVFDKKQGFAKGVIHHNEEIAKFLSFYAAKSAKQN